MLIAASASNPSLQQPAARAVISKRLDKVVRRSMSRLHIPAVSVALLADGRTVEAKTYGLANIELEVRATNRSVYKVGSISKQFLAAALMHLVEQKRIGLDDRICDALPDLPRGRHSVTIRNLMTHTSGIASYTSIPQYDEHMAEPVNPKLLIGWLATMPLESEPGTKWSYSNTGSYLEGLILEKLTGRPVEEVLRESLWDRARMKQTAINSWSRLIPGRVHGYVWQSGRHENPRFEDESWPWAGGGVVSSLDDMVAWAKGIMRHSVVSKASLNRMWQPTRLAGSGTFLFGLDWYLDLVGGSPRVFRTGQGDGFSAILSFYPVQRIAVIVLCNQDGAPLRGLADEIAALEDPSLTPPSSKPSTSDPDPEQTRRLKTALAELGSGQSRPGDVTEGLTSSITEAMAAKLRSFPWERASIEYIETNDLRKRNLELLGSKISSASYYRIRLGGTSLLEGFFFDSKGRLAYLADE